MKYALRESLLTRIERLTGQTISQIRSEPISTRRIKIEESSGLRTRVSRHYPLVGRGCVLGDRIIPQADINSEVDRMLCGVE